MYSLQDLGFAARVEETARTAGLPLDRLVLEVTETALAGDAAAPLEVLTRLALNGVALSIDDYGTGYATLDQLDRIPFSELKIDHTFIRRSGQDEQTRIIVESSLEMAHRLGLRVVAEGVESSGLWDWVAASGCDLAQGFYIGRPMPGVELLEWAGRWSNGG
jgi:EAL domain-containing protein (putative c-di-GMP-specific phosphodiesterase class I)